MEKKVSKNLRCSVIAFLAVLTIVGFAGYNISRLAPSYPAGPVISYSLGQGVQAIINGGWVAVLHALGGLLAVILSIVVLWLSFKTKMQNMKIVSTIGFLAIIVAALCGILFVLSGFRNATYSILMGWGFFISYLFYIPALYYAYEYE